MGGDDMPRWIFDILRYAPVFIYILVLFVIFVLGKLDNDFGYGFRELTKEEKKAIFKQNIAFAFVMIYYAVMSVIDFYIYEK